MLVRKARSERSVLIEVFVGSVRGMVLVPATFFTKICMVSSDSEAAEVMEEMLSERCMMAD